MIFGLMEQHAARKARQITMTMNLEGLVGSHNSRKHYFGMVAFQ